MKWATGLVAIATALLLPLGAGAQGQDDNLIEEIKNRGVLNACLAEAIPMNYKNPETEEWTGYNVDAGQHLASTLGVDFRIVDATWGTIIPSILTGKCDVALVNLFMTLERAQVVLFTEPWGVVTKSAAVREGSEIDSYSDLNDQEVTIAVLSGTGDENHAQKAYPKAELRSIASDSISSVFVEVASRRADAVVTDTTTLRQVLSANENMRLEELPEDPVAPEPYAYAVAPGQYHWLRYLNIWMDRIESLGLKEEWWKKWMGEDSTPGLG